MKLANLLDLTTRVTPSELTGSDSISYRLLSTKSVIQQYDCAQFVVDPDFIIKIVNYNNNTYQIVDKFQLVKIVDVAPLPYYVLSYDVNDNETVLIDIDLELETDIPIEIYTKINLK